MSTSAPLPPSDDPVARATDALRRAPVPDGPPPETIARTLAALRAADAGSEVVPRTRRRLMLTMLKMAGAVLAAAAGVSYFAGFPPPSATAEFVATARKLQDARTMSFRQTMTIAGQSEPMTGRILYKVPGLVRIEFDPAGTAVSVLDLSHGKVLVFNPADKSAVLMDEPPAKGGGPARRRDPAASMIEDMRQLAQKNGEPAGEKVIGDVRARGFRVKEHGQEMTVWVDPQKKLPVLIECTGRTGNLDFRGTFADIQLDPELDDALFRLDPPAGYTLRKVNAKLMMTPEEAVARFLRTYADAAGGRFPARLDDFDDYRKVVSASTKKKVQTKEAKSILDPEGFEIAAAGAHLAVFCQQMKDHYGYKTDGVKLGDAKTIIFWYQPVGQTRYKAVYGDLHIGDVAAEELPVKP
jgi:outer membrane lipoprotein-sorting protein